MAPFKTVFHKNTQAESYLWLKHKKLFREILALDFELSLLDFFCYRYFTKVIRSRSGYPKMYNPPKNRNLKYVLIGCINIIYLIKQCFPLPSFSLSLFLKNIILLWRLIENAIIKCFKVLLSFSNGIIIFYLYSTFPKNIFKNYKLSLLTSV